MQDWVFRLGKQGSTFLGNKYSDYPIRTLEGFTTYIGCIRLCDQED